MKKFFIFIVLGIVLIIGISIFFFNKNNSNKISENNETEYTRTSTGDNENSNVKEETNSNKTNNDTKEEDTTNKQETPKSPVEEELASFSTKIYTKNDSSRQKNLGITSSKLNGTIVEPGQTFSFTSTVGKASPAEGYEKADIYDEHGNKVKGYGGGNCQISSTLYNVVLQLSSLKVTERHPHAKKVPYVKTGKDAAVAYGSIDFKFVNNYEFPIKIYCSVDKNNVYTRIVKLS